MGDAEIIPIGTRGRPGRGAGKQPSAAARDLAGNRRRAGDPVEPDEAADQVPETSTDPAPTAGTAPPDSSGADGPAGPRTPGTR